MDFDYTIESINTASLRLSYFLVPWDTAITGRPVAEISHLELTGPENAAGDYEAFRHWCREQDVFLCSCRLEQDKTRELYFLQERGFRFIELNYRPQLAGLQQLELRETGLRISEARRQDREILAAMAGEIFTHGRFHQDPALGPVLGNRRYRIWMENSFDRPQQKTLKCEQGNEIIGFAVVEYPQPGQCFWSLIGMAPGRQGRGLGKKVFRSFLRHHQADGMDNVGTSVSSHNVAAFNLYISLRFRFPQPLVTLHWHRQEAKRAP